MSEGNTWPETNDDKRKRLDRGRMGTGADSCHLLHTVHPLNLRSRDGTEWNRRCNDGRNEIRPKVCDVRRKDWVTEGTEWTRNRRSRTERPSWRRTVSEEWGRKKPTAYGRSMMVSRSSHSHGSSPHLRRVNDRRYEESDPGDAAVGLVSKPEGNSRH